MQDFIVYGLPVLFFIVSFVYSSIGMGGGSSYTAILIMTSLSITVIPVISLTLNVLVTTLASINFIRKKHAKLSIILPFLLSAIPFSYIGGSLDLPKNIFLWILLISLILVATRIYLIKSTETKIKLSPNHKIIVSILIGSILGLVAGIVGIGGGIYLVPIIIMLNIGTAKQAAASAAIFVWTVSVAGLIPRIQSNTIDLLEYIPIILSVLLGGFLGSHLGSTRFSPKTMERVLGIIILVAMAFVIKKIFY